MQCFTVGLSVLLRKLWKGKVGSPAVLRCHRPTERAGQGEMVSSRLSWFCRYSNGVLLYAMGHVSKRPNRVTGSLRGAKGRLKLTAIRKVQVLLTENESSYWTRISAPQALLHTRRGERLAVDIAMPASLCCQQHARG
jgi:hypothetical protein